jgi:hypothetical protein
MNKKTKENPHHLVMGELVDFLSGAGVPDTHDERYHQKLARYLVETLGYDRKSVEQNREVVIQTNGQAAKIQVDFLVSVQGQVVMLVNYAPGSLVTRRLSNLALSRIILPCQIPVVVTTNGEDAEVIDGHSGKLVGQGLADIPGRLSSIIRDLPEVPVPVNSSLFDKASRIVFACEVDGSCMVNDDFKCNSWYCYPGKDKEIKK